MSDPVQVPEVELTRAGLEELLKRWETLTNSKKYKVSYTLVLHELAQMGEELGPILKQFLAFMDAKENPRPVDEQELRAYAEKMRWSVLKGAHNLYLGTHVQPEDNQCPKCGYPYCFDGQNFKGTYSAPCPHCAPKEAS